ncbi:MAG: nuclear transport factor 2 family protein [Chitinophagaceae bacterium]|nr:nuclear transport factor 2 family protein [Chitinophagaceae bacterium]
MQKIKLIILLMYLSVNAFTQNVSTNSEDETAVKAVVEQFLKAAGNYDIAAMRLLFLPNANIGWHSLKDGKWIPSSVTAETWFESIAKRVNPKLYTEPVSNYTIHISEGRLAFVQADAILHRDGQPKAHNMDFFILMKENSAWKFLSGSFTSVPIK